MARADGDGRPAADRLCGWQGGCGGAAPACASGFAGAGAAGAHGAVGDCGAGAAAADAERQARPAGAAGAGACAARPLCAAGRRATRRRRCCAGCLPRCWGLRGSGRGRGQLLRAWRAFALGDAADRPDPFGARYRGCDPQPVRGAERVGAVVAALVAGARAPRARFWRGLVRPRSRCPMRSAGCGSWSGWRRAARQRPMAAAAQAAARAIPT